ncbi:hypothetical protein HDU78_010855, partial [Chytriomyces hyalinus]
MRICDLIIITAYIPPSADNRVLGDMLQKAETLSEGFTLRCLLVGDLNARMTDAGDSLTNARGTYLQQELTNSGLALQTPESGKWTSWAGGGRGIPDIILSSFPVSNFTVHERESLGGSDHRPMTFSVPLEVEPTPKSFVRWNVRRLTTAKYHQRYAEELQSTQQEVLDRLELLRMRLESPTVGYSAGATQCDAHTAELAVGAHPPGSTSRASPVHVTHTANCPRADAHSHAGPSHLVSQSQPPQRSAGDSPLSTQQDACLCLDMLRTSLESPVVGYNVGVSQCDAHTAEPAAGAPLPGSTSRDPLLNVTHTPNRARTQELINEAWECFLSWTRNAASKSIGVLQVTDHLPSEFWTDELEQSRNNMQQELANVQQEIEHGQ